MKPIYHPSIETQLESLTPLGDFVLVRRMPDAPRGLIEVPLSAREPERGLRRGMVVRVGMGDRRPDGGRHPMYVKPGDTVVYPRVPANNVVLNGDEYTLIHAEQHVLAVLEAA